MKPWQAAEADQQKTRARTHGGIPMSTHTRFVVPQSHLRCYKPHAAHHIHLGDPSDQGDPSVKKAIAKKKSVSMTHAIRVTN